MSERNGFEHPVGGSFSLGFRGADTLLWILVITVCFFILALRNFLLEVQYPIMYTQDGRYVFPLFFERHDFSSIFKFCDGGYRTVGPYLLGYLLTFLPARWIPHGFSLASLCLSAFTYALVFRLGLWIVRDRVFAVLMAFCVAALPLGNAQLVGTVAWQHYNLTIILCLLLLLPFPQRLWSRVLFSLGVNILIWSHPLSIVILPVCVWRLWSRPQQRPEHVLFMVSAVGYGVWGVHPGPQDFSSWPYLAQIFTQRVVLESLIGPKNRAYLQFLEGASPIAGAVFLVLVLIAWRSWGSRSAREKEALMVLSYFQVSLLGMVVLGKHLEWIFLGMMALGRYVYAPKVLFVVVFFILAFPVFRDIPRFRILLVGLVLLLTAINLNSNKMYRTNVEEGKRIVQFFERVDRESRNCAGRVDWPMVLKRGAWDPRNGPGDWSIEIFLCRA
ncbi:MAG: hypothetical protein COV67_03785 [Nitrospinae bacterium CG11_big_fil_rev_8_21_14_0_20_56_8]|nr:MAG: hypothetical protein COV67_03785 [Nitrospinae bacterium CG11_big_fil_rev_8_21_14_0_20_56_8]